MIVTNHYLLQNLAFHHCFFAVNYRKHGSYLHSLGDIVCPHTGQSTVKSDKVSCCYFFHPVDARLHRYLPSLPLLALRQRGLFGDAEQSERGRLSSKEQELVLPVLSIHNSILPQVNRQPDSCFYQVLGPPLMPYP